MENEFKRDYNKYIVIKTEDLKLISCELQLKLHKVLFEIECNNTTLKKSSRSYAVVSNKYPEEFEKAWKLIEDIAKRNE